MLIVPVALGIGALGLLARGHRRVVWLLAIAAPLLSVWHWLRNSYRVAPSPVQAQPMEQVCVSRYQLSRGGTVCSRLRSLPY